MFIIAGGGDYHVVLLLSSRTSTATLEPQLANCANLLLQNPKVYLDPPRYPKTGSM